MYIGHPAIHVRKLFALRCEKCFFLDAEISERRVHVGRSLVKHFVELIKMRFRGKPRAQRLVNAFRHRQIEQLTRAIH